MELPGARTRVKQLQDCCARFDAWDRFNHAEAWAALGKYMSQSEIRNLGLFLKRVISSRATIDPSFDGSQGTEGNGYEVVEDLLLNADRLWPGDDHMRAGFQNRLPLRLHLASHINQYHLFGSRSRNSPNPPFPQHGIDLLIKELHSLFSKLTIPVAVNTA